MQKDNDNITPEDENLSSVDENSNSVIQDKEDAEIIDYTDENEFYDLRLKIENVISECRKKVIGQDEIIELMFICLVCEGHILLEGVPGVAKTLAAKTFAKTIDAAFSRIQFTPDLMPSDIIGTSIFNPKEGSFTFKRGPIFSNVILIDEINRAPAKTQSALFEVMEEKQISYDGVTYPMEFPYIVIATQNPVEQEGTYSLPEAQLDRFLMKINITYPKQEDEILILEKYKSAIGKADLSDVQEILSKEDIILFQQKTQEVELSKDILAYIIQIVNETRNHADIYLGASPRASLAILKAAKVVAISQARNFVIPDDIQYVIPHILGHRIILTPEAEISGKTSYSVLESIIKSVEVPR